MTVRCPKNAVAATAVVVATLACAARPTLAERPARRPSPLWGATQLIPSTEVAFAASDVRVGLRWQVAPLLYSWGLNRRVSPWRSFVVEPNARYGGSVEFFGAAGFYVGDGDAELVRAGLRAYVPIAHRGEHLSLSLGTHVQRALGTTEIGIEAGAYILFGIVGLQATYLPQPGGPVATVGLNVRYF